MEVIINYDQQIEDWKLENNVMKFVGSNTINYQHALGISPQDPNEPECCYFNVWIERNVENSNNGIVFSTKTFNCYKVKNNGKAPTVKFYFDLLDKATFEFAKMFNERKVGTNISNHRISIPQIEDFKTEIQQTIDFWERNIRDSGLN
nr:hypothetical protein [uncultured Flavobacterium sp.]